MLPDQAAAPAAVTGADGVPAVRFAGLYKDFGGVRAVDGIDLEVPAGEFFTMLGPSGSGKTTLLRIAAGFERPTSGAVELAGRDVTRLAPYQRDVNTVFQDYALFPHMTVRQNVEYGLRVKRVPRRQRRERARDALAAVRLDGYDDRKPSQLSGGQRQRVALARALVNRPKVLLLDEPLGALDLKLRLAMQVELKEIQRSVGITFIFVTHDQDEALTMSDRIAVLNDGRIEQVGPPVEVYERPASAFVAGFVGTSNLLSGPAAVAITGEPGTYSVRPEKITIDGRVTDPAGPGQTATTGTVVAVAYVGATMRYEVELDAGGRLSVVRQNSTEPPDLTGSQVRLTWRREHNFRVPDTEWPDADARSLRAERA
jgi:putative spermidine/putrescine transport system ATP-binding protein